MYSLAITIISAALTTALTVAGIYYYSAVLITRHDEAVARALVDQARQIYVASTLYAEEHNGVWPDSAEQLRGRYLRDVPRAPDEAFAVAGGLALISSAHAAETPNPHDWVFVNDPATRRQLYVRLAGEVRPYVCQAVADLAQGKPRGEGSIGRNLDPRNALQCVSGGAGWEAPTFVWVTPGSSHSAVCGTAWTRGEACRYLADGTLSPDAAAEAAAALAEGRSVVTVKVPSGAKLARLEGNGLWFSSPPYPAPSWGLSATAETALTGQPVEYPLDWGVQGAPTPLGWTDSFYPTPPGKVPARKTGRSQYDTEVYATLEEAKSSTVGMCRGQSADIYEHDIDCDGRVTAYAVTCRPSGKAGAKLLAMEMACDVPGYEGSPAPETCAEPYSTGSGNSTKVYTGTTQTCRLTNGSAVRYPEDGRCQMRLRDDGQYEPYPQDPDCASRAGRPGCPVPAVSLDGASLVIDFGMNGELESCAPANLTGCAKIAKGAWEC